MNKYSIILLCDYHHLISSGSSFVWRFGTAGTTAVSIRLLYSGSKWKLLLSEGIEVVQMKLSTASSALSVSSNDGNALL